MISTAITKNENKQAKTFYLCFPDPRRSLDPHFENLNISQNIYFICPGLHFNVYFFLWSTGHERVRSLHLDILLMSTLRTLSLSLPCGGSPATSACFLTSSYHHLALLAPPHFLSWSGVNILFVREFPQVLQRVWRIWSYFCRDSISVV